ncbi:class I tRNA ligase family protein [Bradyrhizobium sp. NBAIM03]|nr:class I tRNA ligase family protein [Bradyrhizobium sp. NBAIM03]
MPRLFMYSPLSKTWTTNALKRSAWTISRQLSWGHRIPAWFGPRQDVEVQGVRFLSGAAAKAVGCPGSSHPV